jgi:hypothetical protein
MEAWYHPSIVAALRLITSSNLVGFCTGRSAGFSPYLEIPPALLARADEVIE